MSLDNSYEIVSYKKKCVYPITQLGKRNKYCRNDNVNQDQTQMGQDCRSGSNQAEIDTSRVTFKRQGSVDSDGPCNPIKTSAAVAFFVDFKSKI